MTVRILSLLVGVLMSDAYALQDRDPGAATLWDKRQDGLWDIGLLDEGAISAAHVNRTYLELVGRSAKRPRLVILSVLRDRASAAAWQVGPPPEGTYTEIIERLRAARAKGPLRAFRLTAMGDNIVVQQADGPRISREVLNGTDPTLFSVGGRSCQLLELYSKRLPRSIRADGRNPVIVDAYVKTDSLPTVAEAEEITRIVQNLSGQSVVNVELRTDTWFIGSTRPLWYPFTEDQQPPTHSQFVARGGIFCSGSESGRRCSTLRYADK